MKRLFAAVALSLAVVAPASAQSSVLLQECDFYWDLALTARAMAMEKVELEVGRRVVWQIYIPREQPEVVKLGNMIVDAAYAAPIKDGESAGHFAGALKASCHRGSMESIIGTSL